VTTSSRPICMFCSRFLPLSERRRSEKEGLYCDAFPDPPGIPEAIIFNQHDHRLPYAGDHGLQFERMGGVSRAAVEKEFGEDPR